MDISFQCLWVNTKKYNCWIVGEGHVYFCKKLSNYLPKWLFRFTFPPPKNESAYCSTSSSGFVLSVLEFGNSTRCIAIPHSCISLMTYPVEHLFTCLFSICISLLVRCLFRLFKNLLVFLLLDFKCCLLLFFMHKVLQLLCKFVYFLILIQFVSVMVKNYSFISVKIKHY